MSNPISDQVREIAETTLENAETIDELKKLIKELEALLEFVDGVSEDAEAKLCSLATVLEDTYDPREEALTVAERNPGMCRHV